MLHHEFITKTDSKSLFNQIRGQVARAQDLLLRDLEKRREHLRELLDAERKIYEDEFVVKIKSRADENIRQRQETLLALKQKRTEELQEFVAEKKIQQNMINCIVIREELRKEDYRETQRCLLKQMEDRRDAMARKSKEDSFWRSVQERVTADYDRKQHHEGELKKDLQANQCRILRRQVSEHDESRKADWAHTLQQRTELDERMKLDRALKENERLKLVEQESDDRAAMLRICAQQKELAVEAENFEKIFHAETMRQVKLEMEEALNRNKGVKEAVHDYLCYVSKFKKFTADQEKQCDKMFADLAENYYCYKKQPKVLAAKQKRLAAEESHKEHLKQICEEMSRKAALKALEKENRMIENRFGRHEVKDKVKERERIRGGLDLQLKEIQRLREEKENQLVRVLDRAEEDQMFCEQLLERHRREGLDFLPPHPNWKLIGGDKDCDMRGGM